MAAILFDYFQKVALLVLTPQCFDNYFLDFNFLDAPCFKVTLSKLLGLAIILGSFTVKVPQILKIVKNKSGKGISITGVSLELTAMTIHMSYSYMKQFPFSAWGDTGFLALQTSIVAFLVLHYSGQTAKGIAYLAVYVIISYVLMSGVTPVQILLGLVSINIPIILSAKLVQVRANYRNGHTGQLAAATVFMLFACSSARIFTSIQETGDTMAILTFVASTIANGMLVFQLLYYWNVDIEKKSA